MIRRIAPQEMVISMNVKKTGKKAAIALFWIAVWCCLAVLVDNSILLVSPAEAFRALAAMLGQGDFYLAAGRSLLRIVTGFAAGFAAGVFLAAASRRFPLLEEVLSPVIGLAKAVPVASFVVLFLIWWGSSFLAVAICFLVVLPNSYISTLEGLKSADRQLLEMAEVFRVPLWNRFFYLYRLALKPFVYSSLKVSLGMCWKSGVAAEVIGTPDYSIGERMYLSKIYLDTAGVFAWTAVIVLLSAVFERVILRLAECFFAWEPGCRFCRSRAVGKNRRAAEPEASQETGTCRAAEPEASQETGTCRAAEPEGSGEAGTRRAAEPGVSEEAEKPAVLLRTAAGSGIRFTKLTKSYSGRPVLEGISAFYEPGRTYYLTSPSGSGKTTLLRVLAGLAEPDSGRLEASFLCSMVFQEDRLCGDYSAVKNVELVIGDSSRAEEALSRLLDREALYKPCSQLSGGMRRRVALVRAMEADSDYVLLDEPFAGMDAQTRRQAEEYIRRKQNGRTLIIATHI